jgi:hypothetical protein
MKPRLQLARLTPDEANQARGLTEKHGVDRAKRMLGISDTRTLYKALAQVGVHPLTVYTIRSRLPDRSI